MTYRVLTVKEQSIIAGLLAKANEALVEANALIAGEAAQPTEKPARKPRTPKVAAVAQAPEEVVLPKKRGRPAKVATQEAEATL